MKSLYSVHFYNVFDILSLNGWEKLKRINKSEEYSERDDKERETSDCRSIFT